MLKNVKVKFSEKLKKLRLLLGNISQSKLAALTGIPQSTIATWEADITKARPETLIKLEKFCEERNIKINWRK